MAFLRATTTVTRTGSPGFVGPINRAPAAAALWLPGRISRGSLMAVLPDPRWIAPGTSSVPKPYLISVASTRVTASFRDALTRERSGDYAMLRRSVPHGSLALRTGLARALARVRGAHRMIACDGATVQDRAGHDREV